MKRKESGITWYRLLLIVLAMVAVVSGTISAYYIKNAGKVTNTFTPADSVQPEVVEDFDGNVKENVYVKVGNTGYPVYVRAEIVITWQKEDGTVYFANPIEDSDYKLDLILSEAGSTTGWVKGNDGYYYYQTPVESDGKTSALIKKCVPISKGPTSEYTLNVEIIVQTVQAIGYTDGENSKPVIDAYKDAWGIS